MHSITCSFVYIQCTHFMYLAVISQLMTLFVPTYSTTNLEIPRPQTLDSNRFYTYTKSIQQVFWYFVINVLFTTMSLASPTFQSAPRSPQNTPKMMH